MTDQYQMERVCRTRYGVLELECGQPSTLRDESGTTYCYAHGELAAEPTYPIDATAFEMASQKARVYELAAQLRRELLIHHAGRK